MRILTGQLIHEGNTFAQGRIGMDEFNPVYGDAALHQHIRLIGSPGQGILDTLTEAGCAIVPTIFGNAYAAPPIVHEDYLRLKQGFLEPLQQGIDVDGVCVALHGSIYSDGEDDPEGDIVASIRELVGPKVPIVVAMDMHATITQRLAEAADALVGYHTAPHTDRYETGIRAAELLLKALRERMSLFMKWIRLPMLLAGEQSETNVEPMRSLMEALHEAESQEEILSASYLLGFPWADSPHAGVSIVTVADARFQESAEHQAWKLAESFWTKRHDFEFTTEAHDPLTVLDLAEQSEVHPVIISDSGDNPTAGASQDLSFIIDKMLQRNMRDALVVFLADAKSYERCRSHGVGTRVKLELGRLRPEPDSPGLAVTADVLSLKEAHGVRCAVVQVDGVTIIIGHRRSTSQKGYSQAVYDPEFVSALGLSLADYKVVVVKVGYLSPMYQKRAAVRYLALTPGDTNEVLSDLTYLRTPRPIYPLDPETSWPQDQ